ncbi:Dipeptidyl-peptidase 5 [invertebrate metagenome]|uniref:Dipeptidyl-peptidase 5 n=1 Tax=invertebrate metagenome TaxID=1711999 RepID=A0A2H9TAX7_9ZZZZ
MKRCCRQLFFLLSCFLLVQVAQAALTIEVTKGSDSATKIAVSPFGWQGNTLLPEDMAGIVENDLHLSGMFTPVSRNNMLSRPDEEQEVVYRDWDILGASYLVTGRITKKANTYALTYELYDVLKRRKILSSTARGNTAQLRALAHHVSDVIYQKITGLKGDFSTRIMYVTSREITPARQQVDNRGKTIRIPAQYEYRLNYADADGEQARVILTSPEPILSPAWSPDGKQVAYASFETGRSAIFIQDLLTGHREQVTHFQGQTSSPAWSPDGKSLAMAVSRIADGNPDIYVMDMATRRFNQVTRHYAIDTEPAWMPDGKSLVFTSNRGGGAQIYQQFLEWLAEGKVRPVAGRSARRLTFEGRFNARAKVVPDGSALVLVHKAEKGSTFSIALQPLQGARQQIQVLTFSSMDDAPSIGPGGRRLIYSVQGNAKRAGELAIMSIDGRVKSRLPATEGSVREPAWGPAVDLR